MTLRDTDRESLYRVMVNVEGEREMVSFCFRTFSPLLQVEYPGYDRLLIVTINQVHWYWLQKTLSDIKKFFGDIGAMRSQLAPPAEQLVRISLQLLHSIYRFHKSNAARRWSTRTSLPLSPTSGPKSSDTSTTSTTRSCCSRAANRCPRVSWLIWVESRSARSLSPMPWAT